MKNKLPSAIVKKYGISKKAWAVYRGASRSGSRRAAAGGNVARRKIRRHSSGRSGGLFGSGLGTVVGAMAYGAGREYVSAKLQPITSKIPLGELSDEAVMLTLSWLLWKKKIPILNKLALASDIGHAGVVIEAARIGQYAMTTGLGGLVPGVNNTSPGGFVYG